LVQNSLSLLVTITLVYTLILVKTFLQNVHVKLNPGLLSQERHSTWRRLLSPAHWTEIEGRN